MTSDSRPGTGQPDEKTEAAEKKNAAWEMIAAGRYQPRRIKGSFPGRELG